MQLASSEMPWKYCITLTTEDLSLKKAKVISCVFIWLNTRNERVNEGHDNFFSVPMGFRVTTRFFNE